MSARTDFGAGFLSKKLVFWDGRLMAKNFRTRFPSTWRKNLRNKTAAKHSLRFQILRATKNYFGLSWETNLTLRSNHQRIKNLTLWWRYIYSCIPQLLMSSSSLGSAPKSDYISGRKDTPPTKERGMQKPSRKSKNHCFRLLARTTLYQKGYWSILIFQEFWTLNKIRKGGLFPLKNTQTTSKCGILEVTTSSVQSKTMTQTKNPQIMPRKPS